MLSNGQPRISEEWVEYPDDGHRELLEVILTPLTDETGNPLGVLGVGRDITRRKAVEQELEQHRRNLEGLVEERTAELVDAKEEALAAARVKSDFLANMSHEIRTPLNAIVGFSGMGVRGDSRYGQDELFDRISRSGQHLLGIVNDILDFSKIEAGMLQVESRPFQLRDTVGNTVSLVKDKAEGKGLDLRLQMADAVPDYVNGDLLRV